MTSKQSIDIHNKDNTVRLQWSVFGMHATPPLLTAANQTTTSVSPCSLRGSAARYAIYLVCPKAVRCCEGGGAPERGPVLGRRGRLRALFALQALVWVPELAHLAPQRCLKVPLHFHPPPLCELFSHAGEREWHRRGFSRSLFLRCR